MREEVAARVAQEPDGFCPQKQQDMIHDICSACQSPIEGGCLAVGSKTEAERTQGEVQRVGMRQE